MSQARLRSLLAAGIWTVVSIGFGATVLVDGGPATYADDPPRRLVGAIFLAAGIFGNPLMRFLTRSKPGAARVFQDERDEKLGAKATSFGLVVVAMGVFLANIALWDGYEEAGSVPVGWMWILAYGTLILTHLVPALAFLALDLGMVGRGQE
jgi:hypothetical protein